MKEVAPNRNVSIIIKIKYNETDEIEIDYRGYIENMMEVDWKNGEIISKIDELDLYEIVLSACHEQSVKNGNFF